MTRGRAAPGERARPAPPHSKDCLATLAALLAASMLAGCSVLAQVQATPVPTPRPPSAAPRLALTPAPNVPGDPNHGRELFLARGCGGCHTLYGVEGATGVAGPNLTNVTLRPTIAGNTIPNTPENLARWIMDPPSLKPGTAMPSLGLSQQEAQDVAAFLSSLPYNPPP